MSTYVEIWDPTIPPGGFICGTRVGDDDAICGTPVESEPCPEHAPRHPCGHDEIERGCGGCDPSAIEFVIADDGTARPFDPSRDLQPPAPVARDFLPDASPDHHSTACVCLDCLDAQAQDDADEQQAWERDEAVMDQ